jgi:hypothetical protein
VNAERSRPKVKVREGHVVEGIHLGTFLVLSEMSLDLAVSGVSARQHEAS